MSAVEDALLAVDESWAGYGEAETLAQEFRWAQTDLAKAHAEIERLRARVAELEAGAS